MWGISPEVWHYMFTCWGAMALGAVAGCILRWRRQREAAARERAAWEEVSL
jgi:hypothetical protein